MVTYLCRFNFTLFYSTAKHRYHIICMPICCYPVDYELLHYYNLHISLHTFITHFVLLHSTIVIPIVVTSVSYFIYNVGIFEL